MRSLAPISLKERIGAVDAMRGLAILGILFVNMPNFNSSVMYVEPGTLWEKPIDRWAEAFIDIFAQASFYTLFSFLFGFGAVIFCERARLKGYSYARLFGRRLFALLFIGCIHAFLIWYGDILISYAVTGALLLLLYNVRPRYLLIWAAVLFFVPNVAITLFLFIAVATGFEDVDLYNEELALKAAEHYKDGTFFDIFWQRWQDWLYINGGNGIVLIVISLLPMFLLGAYAAKKQWFSDGEANRKTLVKIGAISFVLGATFKLLPYWTEKNVWTEYVQDMFGGPATAIFYAVTVALLWRKPRWNRLLSPLAAVGRLSLTNYLLQSIVCTFLFYNYGLGLYGSISPFYGLLLTIAIYVLQIVFSQQWLKRYRMGPAEWIWRTLTYGQKQPFKTMNEQ